PVFVPVVNFVAARPCASVVAALGETEPPPAVTANETDTPALGLLSLSVTRTRTESPTTAPATVAGTTPTAAIEKVGGGSVVPPQAQRESAASTRRARCTPEI